MCKMKMMIKTYMLGVFVGQRYAISIPHQVGVRARREEVELTDGEVFVEEH